ncbi:MAG: MMPL family transporter [Alicyclobacillaceae bacterium]|nr:MMPL family transporter [Alicyclobacillaceae bacterium]
MQRLAQFSFRRHWLVISLWLAALAAAILWLPGLSAVVAHQSTTFLPGDAEPVRADRLLNRVDPSHHTATSAVIAIRDERGLSAADREWFRQRLQEVKGNRQRYGVSSVQDEWNTRGARQLFVSRDGTTEIALVGFPHTSVDDRTAASLSALRQTFSAPPKPAAVWFTGDAPIQQDEIRISQRGVERTGGVTVALVLVILLAVFRSVVAPLVTLMSIGLSFLLTSRLVAGLASVGLPVSTFTQTFLIAVLFGAGTDYTIMLLMRFREELAVSPSNPEAALARAIPGAGRSVLFSGLTVLVSFLVLALARFGLYRSGVGVAIGLAVTLLACFTFVPALIRTLGPALFWPRKPAALTAHRSSRFWQATGKFAVRRPWWTLGLVALALAPIASLFTNLRTFDPLSDIPSAPSATGLRVMADAFGAGRALPMELVVHTDADLRTPAGLAAIEQVSQTLASQPGVQEVDSATRPLGQPIAAYELANQNQQAAAGLQQVNQGLATIARRLQEAGESVQQQAPGVQKLADASRQVAEGTGQLYTAAASVARGSQAVSAGTDQLQTGANQLKQAASGLVSGFNQAAAAQQQVAAGLRRSAEGMQSLTKSAQQLSQSQQELAQAARQLADAVAAWAKAHPEQAADPNWQAIQKMAEAQAQGQSQTAGAAAALSQNAQALAGGLSPLADAAGQAANGAQAAAAGAAQLADGAGRLAGAAGTVAEGANRLTGGVRQLADGAQRLAAGSRQVAAGVSALPGGLRQMGSGYAGASQGLRRVQSGLREVQSYLRHSATAAAAGTPGFYLPSVALDNPDVKRALDTYVSADGHIAKFQVIPTGDPYATTTMASLPHLKQAAAAALAASPIHGGTFLAAGTTAQQYALNQISNQDFVRTVCLILAAIFLLLTAMLRSVVAPLYILASLAGSYFVTMGVVQTVSVHLLHKAGLNWTVPFFVFFLLVALGVDYSIFLMARFQEEHDRGLAPAEAVCVAMENMGNVIFSAAVIMAGTFGSMVVSGVTSLVEIAIAVVFGLLLYTVPVLGLFVPACAAVVGRGHHWPFVRTVPPAHPESAR